MAPSLPSLTLAEALLASLCLTTCLYGLSRKWLSLSTDADTAISVDRRFLRIFHGCDSDSVSQHLREHPPTAHEGSSSVIRDASAGDLGTRAPFPRIDLHLYNAVVLIVYLRRLDPGNGCICRWNGREY